MKKASLVMITLTLIFAAFAGGLFLGRNFNRSPVSVSSLPHKDITTVALNTTESKTTEPIVIDINSATAEEFMTLPGIGQTLANRIVAYRDANGPFTSLGELCNVEGIGDKKLESILDHITIGGQG